MVTNIKQDRKVHKMQYIRRFETNRTQQAKMVQTAGVLVSKHPANIQNTHNEQIEIQ